MSIGVQSLMIDRAGPLARHDFGTKSIVCRKGVYDGLWDFYNAMSAVKPGGGAADRIMNASCER